LRELSTGRGLAKSTIFTTTPTAVTHLAVGSEVAGSRWLVANDGNELVRVWDLAVKTPPAGKITLSAPTSKSSWVSFQITSDNKWMVAVQKDGQSYLWNLSGSARSQADAAIAPRLKDIHEAIVTADARWLVSVDPAAGVRLVDLQSATLETIVFPKLSITASTSPDSRWLATGGFIHPAFGRIPSFLLSLSGRVQHNDALQLNGNEGNSVIWAFSQNGQWLLNGSADGTCRVWRLNEDLKQVEFYQLKGPEMDIAAAVFVPGGRQVAVASRDGAVRLWELPMKQGSNTDPAVLGTLGAGLQTLNVGSNARWLMATRGSSLFFWALDVQDSLPMARRMVGRNLDPDEWGRYFGGAAYTSTFPDLPAPGGRVPQPTAR
jgi:WD40 repeat protein